MKYENLNFDEHMKNCPLGKRKCAVCRHIYFKRYWAGKSKNGPRQLSVKALLEKAREYNERTKGASFKMTDSRAFIEHEIYIGRMVLI